MTFAVEVTTDLFEPELPKGTFAIIDPDRAPADDEIVLARFNFSKLVTAPDGAWTCDGPSPCPSLRDTETLTVFWGYSGRDMDGRFCKRGDLRETCSLPGGVGSNPAGF